MCVRFYLTTSLIGVFINSLYCIAACKHYRTKYYFGFYCINKVSIIRMMYVSSAKRIQLSEEAQKALEAFACYKMTPRGEVVVKVRIFRRFHSHWDGGLIVTNFILLRQLGNET